MTDETRALESLWRFNQLHDEMEALYHRMAARCGLSDSAFIILYVLCQFETCRPTDICAHSFLSKQTVSSALQKLQREGLLESQAGPGRQLFYRLSEAGKQISRERVLPIMRAEAAAFDRMGDEQEAFLALYRQYLTLLREEFAAPAFPLQSDPKEQV